MCTYLRNWDFAVDGSPTMHTFTVPLSLIPSCVFLATPDTNCNKIPCLMSLWPKTAGAILSARESYNRGWARMRFAVTASMASRGVTMSPSTSPGNIPPPVFNCRRASSASSSSRPRPSASSARSTPHAEKSILYVISRVPATLWAPVTPCAMEAFDDCTFSPARAMPPASGTTHGHPVATILSPAFTCSTISSRTIKSKDRGNEPAGISSVASCTRMRCQSANLDRSIWSCHLFFEALLHWGFRQMVGVVYRICWGTSGASRPHFKHRKLPAKSSGRTSDVRVTTARHCTKVPILSHRRSLNFSGALFRFRKATKNVLESMGSACPGRRSSPVVTLFLTSRYALFAPLWTHV